jgi:beta-galactosidase GanA
VGLTFELFLRAFGELDILHEDQVTDDRLNGYKVLVLGDVKLLPATVASHIQKFVEKGGIVIADCIPQMDAFRQPLKTMTQLFGVRKAGTNRVVQEGQWVPFATLPPKMSFSPPADQGDPEVRIDGINGRAFGKPYQFKIVSPRPSELTDGKVLLNMNSGQPAVIRKTMGKGKAYLLAFCLQDTYFQTFKDSSEAAREQLRDLISSILKDAKAKSHIYSSNSDIEATLRANKKEGYIFIINHESSEAKTKVRFAEVGFEVGKIMDIETGKSVDFSIINGGGEFAIAAPLGTTRLLKLFPK